MEEEEEEEEKEEEEERPITLHCQEPITHATEACMNENTCTVMLQVLGKYRSILCPVSCHHT